MNYFKLLDITQKYDLDLNLLKAQYLNKQKTHHPDRAKNDAKRKEYITISMDINKAYKILKDDYLRAEYLLELLGQKFDDKSLKNLLSTKYLEEIMYWHELVDEHDQPLKLNNIMQERLAEEKKIKLELIKSFAISDITKSLDLTIRLKYLTNLVRNIRSKIQACK